MKKTLLSSVAIAGMAIVMFFTGGCTTKDKPAPNDVCPNKPGIQTSTSECVDTPIAPDAPYLNISLKSDNVAIANGDTLWFKSSFSCSFTSDGVVKKDGSDEVSNPIIFSSVTAPISFQLSATKTVNGVSSTPTVVVVNNPVRSEHKTNICKDVIWRRDTTYKSNTLFSVNEVPASYTPTQTAQDNYVYQFSLNNTYLLTIPGVGTYTRQYHFENLDTKMIIDNTTLEVRSSSPTRLVLSGRVQAVDLNTGQPLNQWVEYLIVHKKV